MSVVEDIANRFLAIYNILYIGIYWASNFVKYCPELQIYFQRKYNYQRAKYEDPEVIYSWFELVYNIFVKYRIYNTNIYNFDKTGFIIGIILTAIVVTSSERQAKAKKIQSGNRE
jgi:hypothetical protein